MLTTAEPKTAGETPVTSPAPANDKKPRVRKSFARFATTVEGLDVTFACQLDGVHVWHGTSPKHYIASYMDVYAVCMKQPTLPLV